MSATTRALRGRNPVGPRDELAVRCWCEAVVVFVPKSDVARGLTKACHRHRCRVEDHAARGALQAAA